VKEASLIKMSKFYFCKKRDLRKFADTGTKRRTRERKGRGMISSAGETVKRGLKGGTRNLEVQP